MGGKCAWGDQVVDDWRRGRGPAAGHALHPGHDPIETVGVARERCRERLEIGDGLAQRLGILRQNRVDAAKRVAGRLSHALTRRGIGGENGRLARWPGRRRIAAAFERDRGYAGQALKLQSDIGIGAHRRVCRNRDPGQHLSRIVRVELKLGDLPDTDAVEQNGCARQQSRHGVLEADEVDGPLVQPAGVVQPVYETEHRADGGEHEKANESVGRAGFHRSPQFRDASRARARSPWK